MNVWLCVVLCTISVLLGYLATVYQQAYISEHEFSIKKIAPKSIPFFLIYAILSCIVCILQIKYYSNKDITLVHAIEEIVLWQGLLISAWTDLKVKKIPNEILIILLILRAIGIPLNIVIEHQYWKVAILSSLAGFILAILSLVICRLITKGGLGAGDIKTLSVIGFYTGIIGYINVLFYSIFIAAIISIGMLLSHKAGAKAKIPFGPFIIVAYSIFLFLE